MLLDAGNKCHHILYVREVQAGDEMVKSFSRGGPFLWTALPKGLCLITSMDVFKARLKMHYLKIALML